MNEATALGLPAPASIALWGLIATAAMTLILEASQTGGLSRLSLPFLYGTFITGNRRWAYVWGFTTYVIGGWLFALIYYFAFVSLGQATWWLGGLVGLIHGFFLVSVMLPLLPFVHPRMATLYQGPRSSRRLEPPGFLGLNYGYRTPLITLVGQLVYGVILGAFLPVP